MKESVKKAKQYVRVGVAMIGQYVGHQVDLLDWTKSIELAFTKNGLIKEPEDMEHCCLLWLSILDRYLKHVQPDSQNSSALKRALLISIMLAIRLTLDHKEVSLWWFGRFYADFSFGEDGLQTLHLEEKYKLYESSIKNVKYYQGRLKNLESDLEKCQRELALLNSPQDNDEIARQSKEMEQLRNDLAFIQNKLDRANTLRQEIYDIFKPVREVERAFLRTIQYNLSFDYADLYALIISNVPNDMVFSAVESLRLIDKLEGLLDNGLTHADSIRKLINKQEVSINWSSVAEALAKSNLIEMLTGANSPFLTEKEKRVLVHSGLKDLDACKPELFLEDQPFIERSDLNIIEEKWGNLPKQNTESKREWGLFFDNSVTDISWQNKISEKTSPSPTK